MLEIWCTGGNAKKNMPTGNNIGSDAFGGHLPCFVSSNTAETVSLRAKGFCESYGTRSMLVDAERLHEYKV